MTRISPERSRELREGAQPGPWVYNRPIVETDGGRGQLTAADPEYGVIDEGDGPLVAAAPDLAETIAGMSYEYAVQFKHGDMWEFENAQPVGSLVDDLFSEDPSVACWWRNKDDAQRFAASAPETTTRIVCRLVSDPEVAE